jgi:hypothetical protein
MENKTYMIPPFGGKSILRSTGEEVEIIDSQIKERGARSDEDWVTYIDSEGKEHIKEHLNMQLDFKPVVNDTWNSMFDWAKNNKMPTTRNCRIFEVAKELIKAGRDYSIDDAIAVATKLVDEVGIETV